MKKIILSTILFLSTVHISSQELSQAYLESLPESVRKNVLETIDNKELENEDVYKRPSTMVEKDLIEDTEEEDSDSNVRFGDMIFQSVQSSFMPINEPNFDGSYLLGFGDILELQLTGQKDVIEELQVKRDGSISIPEIGKVFLSGLSLESASALIKAKVSNAFIGVEAYVSLINVRDIQILISGNAYKPGMYTFNGNSSVLHALVMAGGIDDKGSYRQIDIIRNNNVIETVDLYDIFILGKSKSTTNLRSGDIVHIKQHINLVHAVSGVNRPMIYELKEDETFLNLVNYANGFSSEANQDSFLVERISNGNITTFEIGPNDLDKTVANDNDSLIVEEFVFGKIEIIGAVKRPGFYKINENTKLSDILKRAGGYKASAYPFGGYLTNKKTAELNQQVKEQLYQKFIKDLVVGLQVPDTSTLSILESLNETESSGRVMAEFDVEVIESYPELDTRLESDDVIMIPYVNEQVYVYGETNAQGTVKYVPGQSPDYYIINAGGYLSTADTSAIYIVHPNGETISLNGNRKNIRAILNKNDALVYPGSIIYVPQKSNLNTAKAISVWAPIISSLALSLTSLSVINNN